MALIKKEKFGIEIAIAEDIAGAKEEAQIAANEAFAGTK